MPVTNWRDYVRHEFASALCPATNSRQWGIQPIPIEDRVIPELIIGNHYYVCLDKVYYCKLIDIIKDGRMVKIEKYPATVFDVPLLGKGAKMPIHSIAIYTDELGLTPMQAMQHR